MITGEEKEQMRQDCLQDDFYTKQMRINNEFFEEMSNRANVVKELDTFKKECKRFDRDFNIELEYLKDEL